MEVNKKTLIVGIFATLILGVVLVGASSYYNVYEHHKNMMGSGDFEAMHAAMMMGDFEAAEEYHDSLDIECPMHNLVKIGEISFEDFQMMHQWMISGNFPEEKPSTLSDSVWNLHKSHHPEIYNK